MRSLTHTAMLRPEDAIQGVISNVDGTPIMRLGDLSLLLTWDQLAAIHRECLKLGVMSPVEEAA